MTEKLCVGTAWVLAILAVANGCFMLVSPANWYFAVPGVTTTGPFNQHFIRDIGIIFLFVGAGFAVGALRRELRILMWAAPTLWLGCHALFHFWEVAVGICGPSALVRDFWAVTLPAILGALMTWWAIADRRAA